MSCRIPRVRASQCDFYEGEVAHHDLRYYTTILTERAMEFILDRYSSRWLLNLNFTTPHWLWETRAEQAVSDELTARIRAGENLVLVMLHNDGGSLEVFKAMVEDLDRSVGEVMSALELGGAAPHPSYRLDRRCWPRSRAGWTAPVSGARHPKSR